MNRNFAFKLFSKRLVVHRPTYRLIVLICVALAAVAYLAVGRRAVTTRFLVDIIPLESLDPIPWERLTALAVGDRDLSIYDLGGEIYQCEGRKADERSQCLVNRDRARDFIFDHWKNKRRAYIAVDFPCTDCAPTLHMFIEPDAKGKWQIVIRATEPRSGISPSTNSVGLKFRTETNYESRGTPPKRVLVFLDVHGKELNTF